MRVGGVHGGVIDTARSDFQIHSHLIAVKAGGLALFMNIIGLGAGNI